MDQNIVIHDISLTLEAGMITYPKDVPYQRILQRSLARGESSNVSQIEMSAHAGTHVDAPLHYLADNYGVDKIPLTHLYGPAWVADCRSAPVVTTEILKEKVPPHTQRLLLKTDNSLSLGNNPQAPFNPDFVYLTGDAAQLLADQGIFLVGIDYLSIDKSGLTDKSAHHTLLENNITILEGIVLADIEPGPYFLACAPLKMADSDGAPCRTVLIENLI